MGPECLIGVEEGAGVDFESAGEQARVLSMSLDTDSDLLYCVRAEDTGEIFICDPARTGGMVEEWSVLRIGSSELDVFVDYYREDAYDAGAEPECRGWFSAWTRERVDERAEERALNSVGVVGSVVAFGPPALAVVFLAAAGRGYSAIGGH